ncbi:MAG: hypothetical protein V4726_19095 [Verrucomicrobiota bacterium]
MKTPRRLTGFLAFCLLSALAAAAAGRASRSRGEFKPQISAAPPKVRPVDRPLDPAWAAAAAAAQEFVWPAGESALLEQAISNPRQAPQAVYAQIMGLPEDSAPMLREAILKLRGKPDREELMSVLMTRWAAISPFEALEFALTLPPADAIIGLVAGLPGWTRDNPAAALSWAMAKYREGQIPTGVFDAIPSIAWQWGRQDLPGVFTFLQGMEAMVGGRSNGAMREFCSGVGGLALREEMRDAVFEQSFDFAARRGELHGIYETAFLTPLAREKPATLAAWLDGQPDRTVPAGVIGDMLEHWSVRDEVTARQWAKTTSRPIPDPIRAKLEAAAPAGK